MMWYNQFMKRIILVVMLLLPALAFGAPSVKFEIDAHDFGRVKEGEKLEHTFEFANTGTDDLHIEKIHAS